MSSSLEQHPSICLKPREERRIRKGHLWVYSNEVDVEKTPIKGFAPGSLVALKCAKGQCLGLMHLNPNHLICGRLLTRNPKTTINQAYFKERISRALALREALYQSPYYRLMYGEADYLPGVVVDRFDKTLVVQVSTAGMELVLDDFLAALDDLLQPERILLKNDGKMRESEGLPKYVTAYKGVVPEDLEVIENRVRFVAPFATGQKTGWFYDHAPNRHRLQKLVQGKRVLDLCSYVGGWGIQAAVAGASEVLCLDSSQQAMDYVKKNAQLNGVEDKVKSMKTDAFKGMQQLLEEGQSFDIVVIDPPALISRRKDIKSGEKAYYAWNQAALRLIAHSGWLVSASCSMHLSYDRLRDLVRAAGREIDRQLQFVSLGHQGEDHPIHPAIAETDYLKSLLVRVNFVRGG